MFRATATPSSYSSAVDGAKMPRPARITFLRMDARSGAAVSQRSAPSLSVSVWTVGRYLKRWGFTPQKPLRRAYEQDSLAVKQWLETEYPEICRTAQHEKAEIHWRDEMGVRSDYQAGRSYGRAGQTPVVSATGKRFRALLNLDYYQSWQVVLQSV